MYIVVVMSVAMRVLSFSQVQEGIPYADRDVSTSLLSGQRSRFGGGEVTGGEVTVYTCTFSLSEQWCCFRAIHALTSLSLRAEVLFRRV